MQPSWGNHGGVYDNDNPAAQGPSDSSPIPGPDHISVPAHSATPHVSDTTSSVCDLHDPLRNVVFSRHASAVDPAYDGYDLDNDAICESTEVDTTFTFMIPADL